MRHLRRSAITLALLAVGGCDRLFALVEVVAIKDASLDLQDGQGDIDAPADGPSDASGDGVPGDAMTDARPIDAPGDAPTDARPIDAMSDARPIDAPGPVCPVTYGNARGASTYLHVATAATWTAAQAVCLSHQITGATKYTHLAVVSDDPERSYLYSMVSGSDGVHWLGYSDRITANTFRWVTDETGYPGSGDFPWASGQPSTAAGDDCVRMTTIVEFQATTCSAATHHYVCECDDHPNNPANY